jgi:cell division septation protein DedD/nucleoid DNA-binding protein
MNVSKYISALLKDYECVVLPGLGGFISNEQPAAINRLTHEFKPPYHRLFFNTHLKTDDGLLVNHISKQEQITYSQARLVVDEYVSGVQLRLQNGKTVELDNIGYLNLDEEQNIAFDQDFSTNYNADAFGLTSFVSPPVKRETEEEEDFLRLIVPRQKKQEKPQDRRPEKKQKQETKKEKKYARRLPVVIAVLALFVIAVAWGLQHRENFSSYASLFPFSNGTPKYQPREVKEMQTSSLDELTQELTGNPVTADEEATPEVVKEAADVPMEVATTATTSPIVPEEKKVVPVPKATTKQYYIIAGSFGKESNANKLVGQLKKKGFEAMIADTNKNGMFRVAYASVGNLKLAKEKLQAIRQEDNAEAWILKK